ncbi:hypothetical protein Poli38472_014242 [Pythium oligandrum]|uniref:Uncharacterized protein n=1 Tax=Pythium oligandrum TaxID=41045 RepID=A0A8K1FHP8_PYTOL|nr:hypothetical protein Poli38472_014242 [Pythium oligandrum]|eukprot:TMW64125.1 hypothetical protein Poli38472_014242 [Pythium oligandrum]
MQTTMGDDWEDGSTLLEFFDETKTIGDISSDEELAAAAVEIRERNRPSVMRYYYRQISTIQQLRDHVDQLKHRYRQMLQARHEADAQPTCSKLDQEKTSEQRIRLAYVNLAMVAEALRHEKQGLLNVIADHEMREKRLRRLYLTQRRRAQATDVILVQRQQQPAIKIRTVTADECHELVTSAYRDIMLFQESTKAFTSGVSVFAWHDRYQYDKEHLKFSLKKTLSHHSFAEATDRMWTLIQDGQLFAQIYPPKLVTLFHPIQTLDGNNLTYFHTVQLDSRSDFRNKCLMQCSRLSVMNGDGCLMLFYSLDPGKYVLSDEEERPKPTSLLGRKKITPIIEEMWVDMFNWCLFQRSGPDDTQCTVEFGGVMVETPVIPTNWWVVERLQTMLRFEQHVLGQPNRLLA